MYRLQLESAYLKPKAEAKLISFRETSVQTEDGDSVCRFKEILQAGKVRLRTKQYSKSSFAKR